MPEENDRISPKKEIEALKAEIKDLKNAVKALLEGMKTAEDETGDYYMKKGVYLGIDFND